MFKVIFVCSPLRDKTKEEFEANKARAEEYCRYVAYEGHIPYAPHVFFTRFLDDNVEHERQLGITGGIEMLKRCDELWVFGNRISFGMVKEIDVAMENGIPILLKGDIKFTKGVQGAAG
jgi:hypothetical protein